MNLFEKLIELRKSVTSLSKDTEGYGYNYVSGNQVLSKVRDKMDELKLLLIPSTDSGHFSEFEWTNKDGIKKKDIIVLGNMSFTWIDAESEEKFVVPWSFFGQQDDASKAYGSALTYSERYYWLKVLGVPTDEDDPDAKDTRGKGGSSATESEAKKIFQGGKGSAKTITEKQIARLHALAKGNKKIVKTLITAIGYKDEAEIKMGQEYENICKQAERMADEEEIIDE